MFSFAPITEFTYVLLQGEEMRWFFTSRWLAGPQPGAMSKCPLRAPNFESSLPQRTDCQTAEQELARPDARKNRLLRVADGIFPLMDALV